MESVIIPTNTKIELFLPMGRKRQAQEGDVDAKCRAAKHADQISSGSLSFPMSIGGSEMSQHISTQEYLTDTHNNNAVTTTFINVDENRNVLQNTTAIRGHGNDVQLKSEGFSDPLFISVLKLKELGEAEESREVTEISVGHTCEEQKYKLQKQERMHGERLQRKQSPGTSSYPIAEYLPDLRTKSCVSSLPLEERKEMMLMLPYYRTYRSSGTNSAASILVDPDDEENKTPANGEKGTHQTQALKQSKCISGITSSGSSNINVNGNMSTRSSKIDTAGKCRSSNFLAGWESATPHADEEEKHFKVEGMGSAKESDDLRFDPIFLHWQNKAELWEETPTSPDVLPNIHRLVKSQPVWKQYENKGNVYNFSRVNLYMMSKAHQKAGIHKQAVAQAYSRTCTARRSTTLSSSAITATSSPKTSTNNLSQHSLSTTTLIPKNTNISVARPLLHASASSPSSSLSSSSPSPQSLYPNPSLLNLEPIDSSNLPPSLPTTTTTKTTTAATTSIPAEPSPFQTYERFPFAHHSHSTAHLAYPHHHNHHSISSHRTNQHANYLTASRSHPKPTSRFPCARHLMSPMGGDRNSMPHSHSAINSPSNTKKRNTYNHLTTDTHNDATMRLPRSQQLHHHHHHTGSFRNSNRKRMDNPPVGPKNNGDGRRRLSALGGSGKGTGAFQNITLAQRSNWERNRQVC